MQQYGIKETQELMDWLFDLSDAVRSGASDGKITLSDAPLFLKSVIGSTKGLGGINEVPRELADLTDEEINIIFENVKERFSIEDARVEGYIENLFLNGLQMFRNISAIYKLANAA